MAEGSPYGGVVDGCLEIFAVFGGKLCKRFAGPALFFWKGAQSMEKGEPWWFVICVLLMLAGITFGAIALLPFASALVLRINLR